MYFWKLGKYSSLRREQDLVLQTTTIAAMRYGGINNIATFDKDFTKIHEINCIGL